MARNGISVARSKLCRATPVAASCSRAGDHPVASTTSQLKAARSAGTTTCCGIPPEPRTPYADSRDGPPHHRAPPPTPQHRGPPQPQPERHVVHRRRTLQLIDKPQPALRKRQRHHRRTLLRHQRRHHPPPSLLPIAPPAAPPSAPQTPPAPDLGIQGGVDRRDQTHRRQRVPTEIEERIIDPDPIQPEHLGIDPGQDLLDRCRRRPIVTRTGILRGRQRPLVEFAVTVNGNAPAPPPPPAPYRPATAHPTPHAPRQDPPHDSVR